MVALGVMLVVGETMIVVGIIAAALLPEREMMAVALSPSPEKLAMVEMVGLVPTRW